MSWKTLAADGTPDLGGIEAPIDFVRACCRAAIGGGAAGVRDALVKRGPNFAVALATESRASEVLTLGLGVVMAARAGAEVDPLVVEPAIVRARDAATPAEALRLAVLASAAGAFATAFDTWTPHAELDDPIAELAMCLIEGPLDGLRVPWDAYVKSVEAKPLTADAAVEVMLLATAAQLRVHLLTTVGCQTFDALSGELCPRG